MHSSKSGSEISSAAVCWNRVGLPVSLHHYFQNVIPHFDPPGHYYFHVHTTLIHHLSRSLQEPHKTFISIERTCFAFSKLCIGHHVTNTYSNPWTQIIPWISSLIHDQMFIQWRELKTNEQDDWTEIVTEVGNRWQNWSCNISWKTSEFRPISQ